LLTDSVSAAWQLRTLAIANTPLRAAQQPVDRQMGRIAKTSYTCQRTDCNTKLLI